MDVYSDYLVKTGITENSLIRSIRKKDSLRKYIRRETGWAPEKWLSISEIIKRLKGENDGR